MAKERRAADGGDVPSDAGGMARFVEYASKLKGDEKSEAQVFLEHLFQAFGHRSLAETGATLEHR